MGACVRVHTNTQMVLWIPLEALPFFGTLARNIEAVSLKVVEVEVLPEIQFACLVLQSTTRVAGVTWHEVGADNAASSQGAVARISTQEDQVNHWQYMHVYAPQYTRLPIYLSICLPV